MDVKHFKKKVDGVDQSTAALRLTFEMLLLESVKLAWYRLQRYGQSQLLLS